MSSIRIIAMPAGEAPEDVRKSWIGLVLPLHEKLTRPVTHTVFGVLTGPKNFFVRWLQHLFGRNTNNVRTSYLVNAKHAVEILAQHNPEAAQWWYQHTPHYFTSSKWMLAFEPEICELVP